MHLSLIRARTTAKLYQLVRRRSGGFRKAGLRSRQRIRLSLIVNSETPARVPPYGLGGGEFRRSATSGKHRRIQSFHGLPSLERDIRLTEEEPRAFRCLPQPLIVWIGTRFQWTVVGHL
jgi:hypothetical protein